MFFDTTNIYAIMFNSTNSRRIAVKAKIDGKAPHKDAQLDSARKLAEKHLIANSNFFM